MKRWRVILLCVGLLAVAFPACMTVAQLEAQRVAEVLPEVLPEAIADPDPGAGALRITLDGEVVEVSDHAYERHGSDVEVAIGAVANCGEPCRYQCKDGRVRYVNRTEVDGKSLWVIVVRAGLHGKVITAFVTELDSYVQRTLSENGCDNGYGPIHP